jgi:hypothetical protein
MAREFKVIRNTCYAAQAVTGSSHHLRPISPFTFRDLIVVG